MEVRAAGRWLFGFALTVVCLTVVGLVARGPLEAAVGELLDASGLSLLVAATCAVLASGLHDCAGSPCPERRGAPAGSRCAGGRARASRASLPQRR
jgi:hypothetical protein